jgi:Ca2+-binding EF-hand superfamily protein
LKLKGIIFNNNSLEIFLKSNGFLLTQGELKSLAFRLDRDGDGRITFLEFEEIFYLKSNYEGKSSNTFSSSLRKVDDSKTLSGESFFKSSNQNTNRILSPPRRENNLNSSILRESFTDINLKASMNSYTSPRREVINRNTNQQIISSSVQNVSPKKTNNASPTKVNLSSALLSPLRHYNQRIESLTNMNTYTYNNNTVRDLRVYNSSPTKKADSPVKLPTGLNQNVETIKSDLSSYLTRFFSEVLQNENKLETAKENLSLLPDIVLNDLYKMFDASLLGYIGMLDFKDGLKSLDIFSSLEEVKLLFKRYDTDYDGRLK